MMVLQEDWSIDDMPNSSLTITQHVSVSLFDKLPKLENRCYGLSPRGDLVEVSDFYTLSRFVSGVRKLSLYFRLP